jgi:ABC-type siderophore export system fused ATPase/permease subunit
MQNVLSEADLPTGNSLFMFAQSLGTVIALPIAQSIFLETLHNELDGRLSDTQASQIIDLGASSVDPDHMDIDLVPIVAAAYSSAVQAAIYVAVAAAVLAFVTAALMEWKTLNVRKGTAGPGGESDPGEGAVGT